MRLDPGAPAFGGAAGTITLVYANGRTYTPSSGQYQIPADARARSVARSGSSRYFPDAKVRRTHIRVLVQGIGPKGALIVALPLTDIDRTLHNELLLLLRIAAAGIAMATLLGLLVAALRWLRSLASPGEPRQSRRLPSGSTSACGRTAMMSSHDWDARASLELTLVRGDGDRITRAVANLLDDARKWSPAEGVVDVTLRAGTLTVRDQRPGFPQGGPAVRVRPLPSRSGRALQAGVGTGAGNRPSGRGGPRRLCRG